MAQRIGAVACNAEVRGLISSAGIFFFFFFNREIKFLLCKL